MLFWDLILRLIAAACFGALIGLDREYRAKEAGLRTHFLVCVGSALFMIVSQHGFTDMIGSDGVKLDPSRIAAQVVSGIGFLGAGTIIIQKQICQRTDNRSGLMGYLRHRISYRRRYVLHRNCRRSINSCRPGTNPSFPAGSGTPQHSPHFLDREKENLETITNYINKHGHHVTHYSTEEEHYGEARVYRVTMIIKIRKFNEQSLIFQFVQSLPELTINKME